MERELEEFAQEEKQRHAAEEAAVAERERAAEAAREARWRAEVDEHKRTLLTRLKEHLTATRVAHVDTNFFFGSETADQQWGGALFAMFGGVKFIHDPPEGQDPLSQAWRELLAALQQSQSYRVERTFRGWKISFVGQ
jgi:hypothetical protein